MDALDSVLKIEERLVAKATQYGLPIGGTFELLPLCNMNCDMCYIRLNREEMNQRGRLRTVQEWLELAKELKQAGTLFILLTGGEPFLYPYFKELYRGLKELGMIITINTNGTLINEEMAQFLSQDKPRRINVTLYGASNETYEKLCHYPNGYDKTIEGIQLLKKYHLDIKLNGTLVPENQHEVDEMIAFAKEMDLYLKIDTYMFPCSRKKIHPFKQSARLSAIDAAKHSVAIKKKMDSKEYQDYQKYMLDKSHYISQNDDCSLNCRAGKSSFWITWDGYLTPCVFMDEPAIDVFSQPFLVSWEELKEKAKTLHLPVSCQNCSKRGICQVCGACAYCENGNFDEQPHYMCEYIETILEELEKDDEKN